jgi:hypothetical protein
MGLFNIAFLWLFPQVTYRRNGNEITLLSQTDPRLLTYQFLCTARRHMTACHSFLRASPRTRASGHQSADERYASTAVTLPVGTWTADRACRDTHHATRTTLLDIVMCNYQPTRPPYPQSLVARQCNNTQSPDIGVPYRGTAHPSTPSPTYQVIRPGASFRALAALGTRPSLIFVFLGTLLTESIGATLPGGAVCCVTPRRRRMYVASRTRTRENGGRQCIFCRYGVAGLGDAAGLAWGPVRWLFRRGRGTEAVVFLLLGRGSGC